MQAFLKKKPWVILAAGAAIQILTGIPAAWGVFRDAVAKEYAFSGLDAQLAFSLIIAFFGIGCVIGGLLQDRFGPRVAGLCGAVLLGGGFCAAFFVPQNTAWAFWCCFSVPSGLGCAFLYPAVMSCAQGWYADKKGLATGIIGGAVGASGAFLTLTGRWLINSFGIRAAFLWLGILFLIVCIPSALILENPENECKNGCKKSLKDALSGAMVLFRRPQYYLLFSLACLATPAVLLFSPVIITLARQRGASENMAYMCIIIGSFFSAAGRLLLPWLSDHAGRRTSFLIAFGLLSAFSLWFIFAQNAWVIWVYSFLTFCYSGEAAILPAATTDLFGKKASGINYGLVALGMTAGSLVFPLLARVFQNELYSHILAIAAAAIGFALSFFLKTERASSR